MELGFGDFLKKKKYIVDLVLGYFLREKSLFFCLFCCFMSQVNSYGHGTVGLSVSLTTPFPGQA